MPGSLSPKVRAAIELMIFGSTDALPMTRQVAAKAVGLADTTLRLAFRNPLVVKHYNDQLEVLRNGARPRGLLRIIDLVDNARTERVQFEAAKYLDGGDQRAGGVTVNVGVNLQPGYMVDATPFDPEKRIQLLKQARSTANMLIEHDPVADDG